MGKSVANDCHVSLPVPLFFVFLLLITGCEKKKAWQVAYRANYEKAYQTSWEAGTARGREEGVKQGEAAAREAAKTGGAWQLYSSVACWALVVGILVGLTVQYVILFGHAINGCLPGPATFAFIPAMKTSLSYSIFERRFRLMMEFEEQLEKIRTARNLKLAQVQAVHDAVKQRVMATSNLEELTRARLLEFANAEFDKIVSNAERMHQTRAGRPFNVH